MTFSQLAKVLKPFYAGELTIPEFTKELLLQITDYSDAVLKLKMKNELKERNDKTFASYYYNNKPITPIAKLIAADDEHITPDKFMSYLKRNEFDNNKKEKLCKSIEEYVTNKKLNVDNIFDVICDEYVIIIKLSAASSKTQQVLSSIDINNIEAININETILAVESNPKEAFMVELKEVIGKLKDIGYKIASRVSNMKSNKKYKLPEWALPSEANSAIQKDLAKETPLYPELEKEYGKLQEICDSINQYNIEHCLPVRYRQKYIIHSLAEWCCLHTYRRNIIGSFPIEIGIEPFAGLREYRQLCFDTFFNKFMGIVFLPVEP